MRSITAATQTAIEADVVRPVILVDIELDSGTIRANSSDRNLVFGGNTYAGIGAFGGVSAIEESGELQGAGIRLTLTGIATAYVTAVLSESYQGRPVTIRQGFLNDAYTLIADPIVQFVGLIDQMALTLGQTATITLSAEHKLVRWERPNVRRYTDADQQKLYPGDLGLQFISQVVEKEILWGRKESAV
jgi:hypothetical protein